MKFESPTPISKEKKEVAESILTTEQPKEIISSVISKPIEVESEEVKGQKVQVIREDLLRKFDGVESSLEQEDKWIKLENHTFNEDSFYRIVDEKGFKDFKETGVVRSSPTGTDSVMQGRFDVGSRPTPFPSFAKGTPDLSYSRANSDNYIFESGIPMYGRGDQNPATQLPIKGRHWAYRPIDPTTGHVVTEMTLDMIKNVYKLDKDGSLYVKGK